MVIDDTLDPTPLRTVTHKNILPFVKYINFKEKMLHEGIILKYFSYILINITREEHKNNNTVFRQAFLLIQYSLICKQYFFCSHRISIFF